MRIRTLAGALAMSGLVAVSVPADAEAAERRSGSRGRDRGDSSRSYRSSGPQRSSRSYVNRDRGYNSSRSYRSFRSYGDRDRGYRSSRSYRSYDRYRSYAPRAYYRPYRPYRYTRYAYDPYYYGYAYDPYAYEPYGYGYDGYGYDNGPYPRYRSRVHYHGRLFCVRPHLSVHIGF